MWSICPPSAKGPSGLLQRNIARGVGISSPPPALLQENFTPFVSVLANLFPVRCPRPHFCEQICLCWRGQPTAAARGTGFASFPILVCAGPGSMRHSPSPRCEGDAALVAMLAPILALGTKAAPAFASSQDGQWPQQAHTCVRRPGRLHIVRVRARSAGFGAPCWASRAKTGARGDLGSLFSFFSYVWVCICVCVCARARCEVVGPLSSSCARCEVLFWGRDRVYARRASAIDTSAPQPAMEDHAPPVEVLGTERLRTFAHVRVSAQMFLCAPVRITSCKSCHLASAPHQCSTCRQPSHHTFSLGSAVCACGQHVHPNRCRASTMMSSIPCENRLHRGLAGEFMSAFARSSALVWLMVSAFPWPLSVLDPACMDLAQPQKARAACAPVRHRSAVAGFAMAMPCQQRTNVGWCQGRVRSIGGRICCSRLHLRPQNGGESVHAKEGGPKPVIGLYLRDPHASECVIP